MCANRAYHFAAKDSCARFSRAMARQYGHSWLGPFHFLGLSMSTKPTDKLSLANPVHFLALGFGSGLAPRAPGTFGTLAAIPVYLLCTALPPAFYLLVLAAVFAAGVWLCGRTARALGVHDHPGIVWDEVVGYLATMAFAPPGWVWITVGFACFRL